MTYLLITGAVLFALYAIWQESYEWRMNRRMEKAFWQAVANIRYEMNNEALRRGEPARGAAKGAFDSPRQSVFRSKR